MRSFDFKMISQDSHSLLKGTSKNKRIKMENGKWKIKNQNIDEK
jgi:hypothetical protein